MRIVTPAKIYSVHLTPTTSTQGELLYTSTVEAEGVAVVAGWLLQVVRTVRFVAGRDIVSFDLVKVENDTSVTLKTMQSYDEAIAEAERIIQAN